MKTLALTLALALAPASVGFAQSPPPVAQPANPASETMLRTMIEGLRSGDVDYDLMTPGLAQRTREQGASLGAALKTFGELETVEFTGVENGADIYAVRFKDRSTRWVVSVNAEGKLAGLGFRPL